MVINRTRQLWDYYALELEFNTGQGSDYYDGLSFGQKAKVNRAMCSASPKARPNMANGYGLSSPLRTPAYGRSFFLSNTSAPPMRNVNSPLMRQFAWLNAVSSWVRKENPNVANRDPHHPTAHSGITR